MTIDAVSAAMLGVIVIGILCWWHLEGGSNGGYRKAPKASHGRSVTPADHGAGTNAASASAGAGAYGAGQLANAVNYTSQSLVGAQNMALSAAQIRDMHQQAMQAMQMQAASGLQNVGQQFMHQQQLMQSQSFYHALAQPFVPKIADAGIRLGEIEAWRVWRLTHGYVRSVHRNDVWAPGEPMTGKPGAGYGVFAWPTMSAALTYGMGQDVHAIVIGRVHLWGEVIEHERGYRAEFAKIIAFEAMVAPRVQSAAVDAALAAKLTALRERYGLV